ncbi:MAG: hypothetical protein GX452_12845, partial [Ignavibacteriales bacterium]|nr:hypothetical protein [Ignavibacteriales bacterium]
MENQNQENIANKNTNRKRYYHRRRFTPKPDAVPAKDQNIQPVQQPQKQVQQPRPSLQQQNIKQQKPQQKPQVKKLSVVVPLFNEQDSLQPLSAEIRKVCI